MKPKNIILFPGKTHKSSTLTGKNHSVKQGKISSLETYKTARDSTVYQKKDRSSEEDVKTGKKWVSKNNPRKPDLVIEKKPQEKHLQYFPFLLSSVSTGLFLVAASIVLFQYKEPSERGIASEYKEQQYIIRSIQNNHRQISSIGEKPGPLEVLSSERLKSRYNVQGIDKKLFNVVLLDGEKPVHISAIDQFIDEFRTLFPSYRDKVLVRSLSGSQYVYQLLDRKNKAQALVEVKTNKMGGLLSMHINTNVQNVFDLKKDSH